MGTIRRFELDEIQKRYDADVFIETGTLHGDGVDYALQFEFNEIYSIECEEDLHQAAVSKYSSVGKVEIIHGMTCDVFPELLDRIHKSCVFWLDAHFPGADAHKCTYESCLPLEENIRAPLEFEMNTIAKRIGKYRDIIIADDLWMYEDGEYGAGDMNTHCKNHNHNITKETAVGRDASFAYDLFEKSHNVKKSYIDQGYLIFLPKDE